MFPHLSDFFSLLVSALLGAWLATVVGVWVGPTWALALSWALSGGGWALWREHDAPGRMGRGRAWVHAALVALTLQGSARLQEGAPQIYPQLIFDLFVSTLVMAESARWALRLIRRIPAAPARGDRGE